MWLVKSKIQAEFFVEGCREAQLNFALNLNNWYLEQRANFDNNNH
jgi:hypothetical protein